MLTNLVEMDVVLLQRRHQLESVAAKRKFAAMVTLDDQQRNERPAAKARGAIRKMSEFLRSPAGTLSSAGSSGQ